MTLQISLSQEVLLTLHRTLKQIDDEVQGVGVVYYEDKGWVLHVYHDNPHFPTIEQRAKHDAFMDGVEQLIHRTAERVTGD